jgi:hypothetical protein
MTLSVEIELSEEEIYIIYNALNEVCNIVDIPEFEIRLGYPEKRVEELLEKMGMIYDRLKEINDVES